jgi:hypothetical protein
MSCEHATFPRTDALEGACRREIVLHCALLDRLVPKHGRCLADKGEGRQAPGAPPEQAPDR